MTRLVRIPVAQVTLGERHRQDLGDIDALAASIVEHGTLLHPIVVNSRHELVAGHRRLVAWQKAKPGEAIPAHVVTTLDDAVAALAAERDENAERKPLTPSEAVALGRALEELERPKAKARERAGKKAEPGGNLPHGRPGKTRDKVAAAAGLGARTYEKAKYVDDAAKDEKASEEVREVAREAVAEMDRTGKVDRAYKRVTSAPAREPSAEESEAQLRKNAAGHLTAALRGLFAVDAERLAAALGADDWTMWEAAERNTADWFARLRKARPRGLRAVKGER